MVYELGYKLDYNLDYESVCEPACESAAKSSLPCLQKRNTIVPELPEVETVVRTLRPQVVGRAIRHVEILLPKTLAFGEEYLPSLLNMPIGDVMRRGKVLVVGMGEGAQGASLWEAYPLYLAFHLKMTGSFFMHPTGTAPLKHTRLIFDLDEGRLFFDDIRTFGYCRVMRPKDFASWSFWQKLGPEPLDTAPKELAQRFKQKNTSIKAALLDQHVVAGIGNIYADESLFRAGILPEAKASTISLNRLTRLAQAVQDVLQLSIQECGSSIRNYTDAFGNAGAFQNNFLVYGRKGQSCTVCGTSLATATIAARTTVFCPHCQKK